jgi:hypothetical protein
MRGLTDLEMRQVAGGTKSCCCDEKAKGNNGWGNGAEGTNPGSDKGGTAGSKSDEVWDEGDGPRPGKHHYR